MLRSIVACLAITTLLSCTDRSVVIPNGSRRFSNADSARHGLLRAQRSARTALHDAAPTDVALVGADPSSFIGFAQPSEITFTFTGPVHTVTVTGSGAITCSGSFGTLTGYDANGNAIGSVPLQLIDPSDCSPVDNPDNVTFGAAATLSTTGVMVKAILTPMSLLEFPVFDLVGHASQDYTVDVSSAAPPPPAASVSVDCGASPTRGDFVHCIATVTPTQAFFVTQRRAVGAGYSFTSTQRIPSDGAPYDWNGRAVISTQVFITVTITQNGADSPLPEATASFTVTARSGPQWTGLKVPSPVPTPEYISAPPLPASPFPALASGSLASPPGALGQTAGVSPPKQPRWTSVTDGPNANLIFVTEPISFDPLHMYIHDMLLPTSAFARAQAVGNNTVLGTPPCTRSDVDLIRTRTIAHETLHYTDSKAYFDTHDVLKTLEALVVPFDLVNLSTADDVAHLNAAKAGASNAAYLTAWATIADTAVDRNHPVVIPGCRPQQP